MTRIALVFLLLAGCPALAETLPEPPPPPARMPDREAAPIPNRDARSWLATPVQHASVELRLFRSPPYDSGVAFAPGSRFRTPEERKPIQTPGFSVTVPIQ